MKAPTLGRGLGQEGHIIKLCHDCRKRYRSYLFGEGPTEPDAPEVDLDPEPGPETDD
jgi:hypothetical protein